MNILGDFLKRVKDLYSDAVENDELNSLYTQITNMGKELQVKDNEISRLRARLEKYEPKVTDDTESVENSSKKAEVKPKETPKAKSSTKKTEAKPKETPKARSSTKKVEVKPKETAKTKPATKKAKSK